MKILSESKIQLTPSMMNSRRRLIYADRPRTPGVHVQAVNKALGVAAGKLGDSEAADYPFAKFSETNYPLLPALGVAWEELRASLFSDLEFLWQPCELERDGIYGNPDGLLLYDPLAYWECKLTTAKIKRITDCWMYSKQGLSYCAMGGIERVQYDICWVLGDYSRPYQPIGTSTLVEFSQQEIESWWKIVVSASKTVKPE